MRSAARATIRPTCASVAGAKSDEEALEPLGFAQVACAASTRPRFALTSAETAKTSAIDAWSASA